VRSAIALNRETTPALTRARITRLVIYAGIFLLLLGFWQYSLNEQGSIVVYFGRPKDAIIYLLNHWHGLLIGASITMVISTMSLVLSYLFAKWIIRVGLHSNESMLITERFAVFSQTVPMLVLVIVPYILLRQILGGLESLDSNLIRYTRDNPIAFVCYCVPPVTLSLFFPALLYGISSIGSFDLEMKALLRIWAAPQPWRIKRVYWPVAKPHVLTGIRVSSTWAVTAALISEGIASGSGGSLVTQYSLGKNLMTFHSAQKGKLLTCVILAILLGYLVYYGTCRIQKLIENKHCGLAMQQEKKYPISEL
jgi:NitT/TauT family transport system permease protein